MYQLERRGLEFRIYFSSAHSASEQETSKPENYVSYVKPSSQQLFFTTMYVPEVLIFGHVIVLHMIIYITSH